MFDFKIQLIKKKFNDYMNIFENKKDLTRKR